MSDPPDRARDEQFMQEALRLAAQAERDGEVPVGAVLVADREVLAVAANAPIRLNDPTAHAEVLALRAAGQKLGNYRFPGSTMYVTLEPCAMCAAAMVHARIDRIVYAAPDPRTGATGSIMNLAGDARLNHQIQVDGGVMADAAAALLQAFFQARRGQD
jgi:tRNA(adenine34) deaminase